MSYGDYDWEFQQQREKWIRERIACYSDKVTRAWMRNRLLEWLGSGRQAESNQAASRSLEDGEAGVFSRLPNSTASP